ncbi:MAG: glycosyltransferase-like protein, partial [Frankiales bacterium]|nr:glycosyltransferase-like protein [Frankiales bacterium]
MSAPPPAAPTQAPADVVVVLVAHDGAAWLPRTLAALQASTVRPAAVVGVDTGSRDGSAELLAAACAPVLPLPRATGYPDAVDAGLAAAPASRWLWLLHDDSAPAPDALAVLLAHADADPSAVLLGPKAVDWDDPRRLVEVGLTVDGDGVLVRGLEPGEPDQGQHDAVRDVLAVGTAGALVRRDVWDAVGGLDPALPLLRDDVDLGWRTNAFGARVVVVPRAVVQHVRATTTGRREATALQGRRAGAVDRRHAVLLRLAHARVLPLAVLGVLAAAVLRALALVLTRRPADAADELTALGLLARPGEVGRARRLRTAGRRGPASSLRPLFARRRTRLTSAASSLAERVAARSSAGDPVPLRQRPGLLLLLGLLVVAALAERSLLPGTGPVLAGGRLLPAPPGATDLWDAYGHEGAAPVLALLAVLAGPLLGSARAAVDVVLLLSVPLAGLAAYGCSAGLVRSRALRAWAAATWALLPVATGAVAAGRLDAALSQVLLPPVLLLGVRLLARDRAPDGGRAAARLGLLLAVVVA